MKMKTSFFLIGLIITSACTGTGYVPSYIISHTSEEESEEQKANEQEEIR